MRPLELRGCTFGRLTVLRQAGPKPDGARWWECQCSCGTLKEARGADLNRGLVQSCGCLRHELPLKRRTHGEAAKRNPSRLYRIWQAMRDRTTNPRASNYIYYGARGISVCRDWQDFAAFRDWAMAHGYADNLSIDRVNNDGNYEPDNCRWATQKQQVNNSRPKGTVKRKEVA